MFEAQIGKICLKHYTFNYNMVYLIYLLKYRFLKAHGLFFSNLLIIFFCQRGTLLPFLLIILYRQRVPVAK